MLIEDFNMEYSTVVRRLKKLGKVWKLAGWVPHELSGNNNGQHIQIFMICYSEMSLKKPVRRQSGMFGGRETELPTGKSFQTGFIIDGD